MFRFALLALALPLAAQAQETPCPELQGLRTFDGAGTLVADWREVHGLLEPGWALPATPAAALAALCSQGTACGEDKALSVIDPGMDDEVALVLKEAGKLRVFKGLGAISMHWESRVQQLGGLTWVQAEAEAMGRDEYCEKNDAGEEECRGVTVHTGYEFVDVVLEGGKVLWTATCWQEYEERSRPSRLVVEGKRFRYTPCGGDERVLSFTQEHLRKCTAVNTPKATPIAGSGNAASAEQVKKHLAAGRKATQEKRFSDAIAAFDQLLAIDAKHARARSERGFAKLVQGDLDGAEADFDQARGDAGADAKLAASCWFNKGLVAEKRGNPVAAKQDFEEAHKLNPSNATKKKLGLP